jgi:hypothetical protein
VEQMPGVNYWRIQTGSAEPNALHGGLSYRAIPDLNGWMLFVNVPSIDETVELVRKLGYSIMRPKTAVPQERLGDNRAVMEGEGSCSLLIGDRAELFACTSEPEASALTLEMVCAGSNQMTR